MKGPRERNPVSYRIGTILRHRPDMRGLDFRSASPIDQLEASDSAAVLVGRSNRRHKGAFSKRTRDRHFYNWSLKSHLGLVEA